MTPAGTDPSAILNSRDLRDSRDSRAEALAVLERTCDIVLCLDDDSNITYAGEGTARALGLPVQTLLGARPEAWLLPVTVGDLRVALDVATPAGRQVSPSRRHSRVPAWRPAAPAEPASSLSRCRSVCSRST